MTTIRNRVDSPPSLARGHVHRSGMPSLSIPSAVNSTATHPLLVRSRRRDRPNLSMRVRTRSGPSKQKVSSLPSSKFRWRSTEQKPEDLRAPRQKSVLGIWSERKEILRNRYPEAGKPGETKQRRPLQTPKFPKKDRPWRVNLQPAGRVTSAAAWASVKLAQPQYRIIAIY